MTEDALRLILDKNAGLLSILLTGALLPLGILLLFNRHNRKQKESDKSLRVRFNSKKHLQIQEKTIYSSLSKILFDILQLPATLSEACNYKVVVLKGMDISEKGCIIRHVQNTKKYI